MAKDSSSRNLQRETEKLQTVIAEIDALETAVRNRTGNLLASLDPTCELGEMLIGIIASMENAEKETDNDF